MSINYHHEDGRLDWEKLLAEQTERPDPEPWTGYGSDREFPAQEKVGGWESVLERVDRYFDNLSPADWTAIRAEAMRAANRTDNRDPEVEFLRAGTNAVLRRALNQEGE